jgi:transcriptional regulator of acetoin/glycerol metabolism
MICEALDFYHGNIRKASEKLGIGRNTLYRKLAEYNLC